jgi:hypothetical protein
LKNCINCYTLIFSVMAVAFGVCGTGFWYTTNRLDMVNDTLIMMNSNISSYNRQVDVNTKRLDKLEAKIKNEAGRT